MSKADRKPRSDSVQEITRVAQGAKIDIQPPQNVPLDERDMSFFESVIAEFARADWTFHQLELAAMMARTMSSLEEEQRLLRLEGTTVIREIKDRHGEVKRILSCENSRARGVQTLMGQVLAMRRSLALHAKAQAGSNKHAGRQKAANKEIESQNSGEDDLLA